jgi:hypothetical protein
MHACMMYILKPLVSSALNTDSKCEQSDSILSFGCCSKISTVQATDCRGKHCTSCLHSLHCILPLHWHSYQCARHTSIHALRALLCWDCVAVNTNATWFLYEAMVEICNRVAWQQHPPSVVQSVVLTLALLMSLHVLTLHK